VKFAVKQRNMATGNVMSKAHGFPREKMPRNSMPRRRIYVNAAEFRGAAETAPFALDCRQIVLTRVL